MLLAIWGCSNPKDSSESTPPVAPAAPVPPPATAEPAPVSAEQGGEGFTGEGWQTQATFSLIGDPKAVKGGVFREFIASFPPTLRMAGPDASTNTNYLVGDSVYETLLSLHPATLEYIPSLATHWQVSSDQLTFRFRLNPNARFSNGEPVTADDVVASWGLITDKTLRDPSRNAQFGRFEKPVAESRYIVSVKAAKPDWRNLKDFGTFLLIYPASSLKNLTGAQYLERYNFAYLPGSGPYAIAAADIQKDKSLTLRRRKDYWGEKERRSTGLNNFDEVRLAVVTDQALSFEMFKKGDLDLYFVNRSAWWINELNFDEVERGLIQKRKVYNNTPSPLYGLAMNTRRPPFDDIRVRKAFMLLFDRQKFIEQLFLNEYFPLNSYFPGTIYENPSNAKNLYDAQEALRLLSEAGWKDRDAQGRLVKAGKPLVVQIVHEKNSSSERPLAVYQEDLRKVGITLELNGVSPEQVVQLVRRDRQFEMVYRGTTSPVPVDPEQDWHSRLADARDNNNITGFKNPRMDELMAKYGTASTLKEQVEIIRKLDEIMTSQYHFVLLWTAPFERLVYWNRFGHPTGYLTRIGDWNGDLALGPGVERLWWLDPAKEQQLKKAQADPSVKLEVGPVEDKYWLNYSKK
jgi:microcin C transport system substrate-binding protein